MVTAKFYLRVLPLFLLLCASLPTRGQDSQPLPNAPPDHAADTKHIAPNKWYGVVDPGERVAPLYSKDKLVFWLHEEVTPVSLLPAFVSAGYGQLTGGDPKYGIDSGAFGERLGAAAVREASMRFFSDSLFPFLTHSDPRYYRMGSGGFEARAGYAAERLFIEQRDSGAHGFNFSDIFGRLAASSLTAAYYPEPSVNAGVVFKTWGTSLAGAAANNLFLEFWPDIRDAAFHHNHKSRRGQSATAGNP
ncbi:hypothetical protein HNQ77_003393 [Silvibacterium bohemicum]|uniref:Uncharacterized protein n=1 Tax=Silvibacterium bohemicum TaxID=1577686 RepID=A0A841JVL7_9BACT|nr:hypothetical protein [Silvibacterium bohemicum]MBB6145432.1 hypothetical protein [Silvibacterium bohemicum]